MRILPSAGWLVNSGQRVRICYMYSRDAKLGHAEEMAEPTAEEAIDALAETAWL